MSNCQKIVFYDVNEDLHSCDKPRFIFCGVLDVFMFRFPKTSSRDLSVLTGELFEFTESSFLK